MLAKDVMSTGVVSVQSDATVHEAATMLANSGVSGLPVLDRNGNLVGIVSEADLIERLAAGSDGAPLGQNTENLEDAAAFVRANSSRVSDIMSRDVMVAYEDTPIGGIAKMMLDHRVKRIPIVRGRSLVGIVSRIDLVRALMSRPAGQDDPQVSDLRFQDVKLRRDVTDAVRGRVWSLARSYDVVVTKGIVHLWGIAPNETVRRAYRIAAENIPGVKAVENHMHVVGHAGRGAR